MGIRAIIFQESTYRFVKVKQTSPAIRKSKAQINSQWIGKLLGGWALLLQHSPGPCYSAGEQGRGGVGLKPTVHRRSSKGWSGKGKGWRSEMVEIKGEMERNESGGVGTAQEPNGEEKRKGREEVEASQSQATE